MNLDQLIQDADPAMRITIPDHDSSLAMRSFDRALSSEPKRKPARRRRFVVPVSAIAVTAAGAAVALLATGTPAVPSPSAAAAVLNQAAGGAARQQPVVLHQGEYLYTETRTLVSISDKPACCKGFNAEYVATDQSWQTQQGAGKMVQAKDSRLIFPGGYRRLWIEAGRPRIFYSHNPWVSWMKAPKPGSGPDEPIDTGVPLENLSHLPTDPAALASFIKHKTTGLSSIDGDIEDPSTPAGTFWAAMDILSGQSVGGTPALRSALFKVMADQPGITSLGSTRTRSGRAGVGLQITVGHDNAGHGIVLKAIVDPATGQILESETISNGAVTGWTEYLSTGVVNKIGQLPHN
jgi:hypothetical protein